MLLLQVDPDITETGFQLFNKLSEKFFLRLAVDLAAVFCADSFCLFPHLP